MSLGTFTSAVSTRREGDKPVNLAGKRALIVDPQFTNSEYAKDILLEMGFTDAVWAVDHQVAEKLKDEAIASGRSFNLLVTNDGTTKPGPGIQFIERFGEQFEALLVHSGDRDYGTVALANALGAEFLLKSPKQSEFEAAVRKSFAEHKRIDMSQLNILIMEDEPGVSEIETLFMEENKVGATIKVVTNQEEFLAEVQTGKYNMGLVDNKCFRNKADSTPSANVGVETINLIKGTGETTGLDPKFPMALLSTEVNEVDRRRDVGYIDKTSIASGKFDKFIFDMKAAIATAIQGGPQRAI